MTKHIEDVLALKRLRFLVSGGMDPAKVQSHPSDSISPSQARWNLFHTLGIPYKSDKIPHDLDGSYVLDGFTFKLYKGFCYKHKETSATGMTPAEERAGRFSGRAHRLYFLCPVCPAGRLFSIGRFQQHVMVHTTMANATANTVKSLHVVTND